MWLCNSKADCPIVSFGLYCTIIVKNKWTATLTNKNKRWMYIWSISVAYTSLLLNVQCSKRSNRS